jgi:hypothetical protein
LLKKIWNHEPRKRINVHLLEYRGRSNAVPAQPEVEEEEAAPAQSSKLQAPSATKKTQLNSTRNYTE